MALHGAIISQRLNAETIICREAGEAAALLQAAPADLAILAVETTDIDGLDYIPEFMRTGLANRTIITSRRLDRRTLRGLRTTPFAGFIDSATATEEELRHLLSEVSAGRRYVCASAQRAFAQCGSRAGWDLLGQQEQLFLSVFAASDDDKQAGSILGRTNDSMRGYRERIMRKLGLHHKGQLVIYAKIHLFVRIEEDRILHPGFERQLRETRAALSDDISTRHLPYPPALLFPLPASVVAAGLSQGSTQKLWNSP